MTALEQLAGFVAKRGIAARVQPLIRRRVTDIAGAWIAAGATPEGRAINRFAFGDSTLDAIARNCALARLSEIDDIHLGSMITSGAAIIPAALTLGVSLKAAPKDVSDAIVAGYEAMIRLGVAIDGPSILYRGIWPSYFAAPFGVASVAARLMKLPAKPTAHALALALNLSSPNAGHQHGPMTSRWLAFGLMAKNGALAAFAARDGFIGNLDILESGFLKSVYGLEPNLAAIGGGLNGQPAITEVSFKPWCAARQTMAGTQALRELLASDLLPQEINKATVFIPEAHVKMVGHGITPGDRASHLTSLPYQMALAAFAPEKTFDLAQARKTIPRPIADFMAKVTVRGEAEFTRHYPKIWPARLKVETAAGLNEVQVNHVPGDPVRSFDDAQTAQKFRAIVTPVLGRRMTEKAFERAYAALDSAQAMKSLLATLSRKRDAKKNKTP